jgi:hypothetical protein
MGTLSATIEQLASHGWSQTYTILLAMESKEAGAVQKAEQLQEQFGCSFHSIVYTLHVLDPSEMPGKASNVNAAVRQYYQMVTGDRSSYMLTIMDAGEGVLLLVSVCQSARVWGRIQGCLTKSDAGKLG